MKRFIIGFGLLLSISYGAITWTTKNPLPQSLAGSGCAVYNDTIYVIGGRDSAGNRYSTNYIYDPVNDSWAQRANMSTPRAHIGCALVGGKIYAIGGWVGATASGVVEEYDPVNDTWQTKTSMPTPRYGYGIAVVADKIYVIGGMNMSGQIFNTVEEYDPLANSWTPKASMPTARMGPGCTVINDTIYAFGGSTSIGGGETTVNQCYDPVANNWTTKMSMSVARYALGGFSYNNDAYALGGYDYWNYHTTVEVFDPTSNSWSYETSMQYARQSIAVGLSGNNIYVIGGWNNGALNYNEEGTIDVGIEEHEIRPKINIAVGPNPFSRQTSISINAKGLISVDIFDICGRKVNNLYNGTAPCQLSWEGRNNNGVELPSGVYILRINSNGSEETKLLNLIR